VFPHTCGNTFEWARDVDIERALVVLGVGVPLAGSVVFRAPNIWEGLARPMEALVAAKSRFATFLTCLRLWATPDSTALLCLWLGAILFVQKQTRNHLLRPMQSQQSERNDTEGLRSENCSYFSLYVELIKSPTLGMAPFVNTIVSPDKE
jgi:hypothetical protein